MGHGRWGWGPEGGVGLARMGALATEEAQATSKNCLKKQEVWSGGGARPGHGGPCIARGGVHARGWPGTRPERKGWGTAVPLFGVKHESGRQMGAPAAPN